MGTMSGMKTAALILSYNHVELTQKCVRSVQKFFSDKCITLVHNGTDLSLVGKLKTLFPEIHHIMLEENVGYAGGMNKGLQYFYHTFELFWCLVITNDTELMTMDFQGEECGAHIIAPLIYFRSLKKLDAWGGWYETRKGKLHHYRDAAKKAVEIDYAKFYIPGTAFLVHRSVLTQNHYFKTSLFTFWEDVLWSHQAKYLGFKLKRTNLITFKHGGGKTTKKEMSYTSYYYQRNRIIVSKLMEKNFFLRALSLLIITQSIIFQIIKKISNGDWSRGKYLLLALRDGLKFKNDE